MQRKDNENLYNTLDKYGKSVVAEMVTRLRNAGKEAQGTLIKSLKSDVRETVNDLILEFYAEDYYKFVDKGVNGFEKRVGSPYSFKPKNGRGTGTSKMIPKLKAWCRAKGLPENDAFRIRRIVWRYGIAPTQFWSISTKRREKQLFKDIEKAQQKDLEAQLDKIAKEK